MLDSAVFDAIGDQCNGCHLYGTTGSQLIEFTIYRGTNVMRLIETLRCIAELLRSFSFCLFHR